MSEREQELERRVAELETACDELRKTKAILGARTAVAWIGMVSATWAHAIRREVGLIRGLLKLLQDAAATEAPSSRITELLEQLDDAAKRIAEVPLAAPLSTEEGVESIDVNQLLQSYVPRLLQPHTNVDLVLELMPDDTEVTVRASSEWIRRAVSIIVENALQAMKDSSERILTVSTCADADAVEVRFTDTGPGIPHAVLPRLFVESITKAPGDKGTGIGLLLASTIIQTYGGEILVAATSPEGTTMLVRLPKEGH